MTHVIMDWHWRYQYELIFRLILTQKNRKIIIDMCAHTHTHIYIYNLSCERVRSKDYPSGSEYRISVQILACKTILCKKNQGSLEEWLILELVQKMALSLL